MKKKLFKGGVGLLTVVVVLLCVRAWILRPRVDFVELAPEEFFVVPTSMASIPGKPNRLFVAEKGGVVKWFFKESKKADGTLIDLSKTIYSEGWEEGLLCIVFDPDFATNRYFYLFYSLDNPKKSRISRFTTNDDYTADLSSELKIFEISKFADTHNGGQMLFGKDGYLYVSIGEAMIAPADRQNLQNKKTLYGTIIRIDVSQSTTSSPYQVPHDNPFVKTGDGARPEIWAYGFRNPWRFGFDRKDGVIYVADVGADKREEIDKVTKGANYGWAIVEGDLCYPPDVKECDKKGLTPPMAIFDHLFLRSVIGGYVYRGNALPWLEGQYVFGDYLRGLFYIPIDKPEDEIITIPNVLAYKMLTPHGMERGKPLHISTFYEDPDGELYIVNLRGTVSQITDISFIKAVKGFLYMILNFR